MRSQYTFEKKEHYLLLVISGVYDKLDFLSYPLKIMGECEKEAVNKVLIDGLALKGTDLSTLDRFFVGEAVASTLGNQVKIAVAWPGIDINKLFENVAVNRGCRVCVLDSVEAAKDWLLDSNS